MMQDIAILTGGQFIAEELGQKLENVKLSDLGNAKRIVVNKDTTTIIGGGGEKAAIQGRADEIRKLIDDSTSDYDKEKLRERLAKLTGGVAVIRVGAPSETEMKTRKEAFDDAISATKAAMAEGIVHQVWLTTCSRGLGRVPGLASGLGRGISAFRSTAHPAGSASTSAGRSGRRATDAATSLTWPYCNASGDGPIGPTPQPVG